MRSKIVLLVITCVTVVMAEAQVTGFLGRRMAVKATLFNGTVYPAVSLEVEYVLKRRLSLTNEVMVSRWNPGTVDLGRRLDLTADPTRAAMIKPALRMYFNRIIPAPQGAYFSFEAGAGVAYYSFDYTRTSSEAKVNGRKKGAGTFGVLTFPCFGYQGTIGSRFLLDWKVGMDYYMVSQISGYSYAYIRPNLAGYVQDKLIIGPSAYIKAGILIF